MSKNFRLQENLSEDEKLASIKKRLTFKINQAKSAYKYDGVKTVSALAKIITGELLADNSVVVNFDEFVNNLLRPKKVEVKTVEVACDLAPLPEGVETYEEQVEAATTIVSAIRSGKHLCEYVANAGDGKTFVLGRVITTLMRDGFFTRAMPSAVEPVWLLTAATAIVQTERVLHGVFNIPRSIVHITNYEDLRSKDALGSYMKYGFVVKNGKEVEDYTWNPLCWPKLMICDEAQRLKNWPASTQSQILMKYADIYNQPRPPIFDKMYDETYMIRASATPGSRVSDFAISLVAARIEV